MTHWRTTMAGALTILAALANAGLQYLNGKHIDLPTLGAAFTAGVGLILAADGKNAPAFGTNPGAGQMAKK